MKDPSNLKSACRRFVATRTCALLAGVGMAMLLAPGIGTEVAHSQEARAFTPESVTLQQQVIDLEQHYLKPAILRSRYKMEARFSDAKVAYLLKDYPRASLLFVGLVEQPKFQALNTYVEGLYLLADSLYLQRNLVAARKYFEQVINQGDGPYYQISVVKLLELAATTGNYEGVDELYATLDGKAKLNPAVNYVRAKVLYRQGRFAEARQLFQRVETNPDLGMRAAYYRGVAFAADNQLENARQVFDAIIAGYQPADDSQQRVLDLAYLGAGRVAYELKDYPSAIDYYQHLGRNSPYFDQMLYELTWTLVAQEKYEAASRVTDIFMFLSNPDPTFVPKVKLLRADLQLRLGNYDQATESYNDVVETFMPVKRELDAFVDGSRDLDVFFSDLVDAQMRGEDPEYMPGLVLEWVEGSKVLNKAKLTGTDLHEIRAQIADTQHALDEMDARLASGTRIQSFPELAEGMIMAVTLENRIVDLREEMVQAEYQQAAAKMSPAQQAQWDSLQREADALRAQYQAAPSTKSEVEARIARIDSRFAQMRRELDTITFELDGQKEQLQAIELYLVQNADQPMSPQRRQKISELQAEARADIEALRAEQSALRAKISVERQRLGVGDQVTTQEGSVRASYGDVLARQRQLIAQVNGGAVSEDLRVARENLARAESRLHGFSAQMDRFVGERSAELLQDLALERQMLDELDRSAQNLLENSKVLTARVAHHSFLEARHDFNQIIMRGDIGLIDVAWQKKEDATRQINQLFEDRTAELKTLQEAFEEVR